MQNRKRQGIAVMSALSLILTLMLAMTAFAKDQPRELTVDGVNAFETSSGDGWTYDDATETLTLNNYNGGAIIAHCDLTVVLAAGSTNQITAADGTALGNGVSFGQNYSLTVQGEAGGSQPALYLTGVNHSIHSVGNMTIRDCQVIASNTSPSPTSSGDMEGIQSEYNLTIENCALSVTSNGVGLSAFDAITITDSDVTVDAGLVGIHANNTSLEISGTTLDVTGKSGAALQSRFGGVYLNACSGSLASEQVGISTKNVDLRYQTEINQCDLSLQAPFGVLANSDIVVQDSTLSFADGSYGLYFFPDPSLPQSTTGKVSVQGNSVLNGSGCSAVIQTTDTVTTEQASQVHGAVASEEGKLTLSGVYQIDADYTAKAGKSIVVASGAEVTIAPGVTFDVTGAGAVTVDGTLINQGTILADGSAVTNHGVITNNGIVTLKPGTAIQNDGTISSICTAVFDVEGNELTAIHAWDEGTITSAATTTAEGIKTYICQNDAAHTKTEVIPKLAMADYSQVDAAIAKIPSDLSQYTAESAKALNQAKDAVIRGLEASRQEEVDAMAEAIEKELEALVYQGADYSKVDAALAKIPSDLSPYTAESVKALNEAKNAVVRGKNITEQKTVDEYAAAIEKAVSGLQKKTVVKPSGQKDPQTGDHSQTGLYVTLAILAAAGLAALVVIHQKKKRV